MASNPAYLHVARELELPDLLTQAELVRATTETPGWRLIVASVAAHEQKMLARLLNETAKPEEVPRLRGLLNGLAAVREAPEAIQAFAVEREREANQRLAQEQLA